MTISYLRQTKDSFEQVVKRVERALGTRKLDLVGTVDIDGGTGKVFHFRSKTWDEEVITRGKQIFGLLPSKLLVSQSNGTVAVGILEAGILGQVAKEQALSHLATQVEETLRDLIHEVAGVDSLRPKEIKLYATMTCPYCKMEEAWLTEHKVPFTLVHVDLNPDAAQEMVNKTGQMGVPVTEIAYEDQESEYLVGFDKPRLAKLLNL